MRIITTVKEMQQIALEEQRNGNTIGFVPTMGALHDGHGSLIRIASSIHPVTVVSVFVNPTQFGPTEDFATYPRSLDRDAQIIEECGGNYLFAPSVTEMYPNGYSTEVSINHFVTMLEGAKRPGHFLGVATVVGKLFNAVLPQEAFFGQKDLQQTMVIKRMASDLLFPVKVTVLLTVREDSGLAMSSRNQYLSADERSGASAVYKALQSGKRLVKSAAESIAGVDIENEIEATLLTHIPSARIDYVSCADPKTLEPLEELDSRSAVALLIAVFVGNTRLIDNVLINLE